MKKIFLAFLFCFGLMFVSATPLTLNDTSPTNLVTDVKIQKNTEAIATIFVAVAKTEKNNLPNFTFCEKQTILSFSKNYFSGEILQNQINKNYDFSQRNFTNNNFNFKKSNFNFLNCKRNIWLSNCKNKTFTNNISVHYSKNYNLPKHLKFYEINYTLSFLPEKEYLVIKS